MSMKLQGYKSGNVSAPIYQPSTATLAFAALTGRLAWLEGDEGALISNGKWYDRMSGVGFPVTGTLIGGSDTHTTSGGVLRGGAVFSGQTVDLGAIFPTNADYSLFAVYKQSPETSQAVHGIVGGSAPNWHSLHLTQTSGFINLSHAATSQFSGNTAHAPGSVYRVGTVWVDSRRVAQSISMEPLRPAPRPPPIATSIARRSSGTFPDSEGRANSSARCSTSRCGTGRCPAPI